MEVPIELCVSAKVYSPSSFKQFMLIVLVITAYVITIPYCINTAGEPRQTALIQAQKLYDEKWAAESVAIEETFSMENTTLWATNQTNNVSNHPNQNIEMQNLSETNLLGNLEIEEQIIEEISFQDDSTTTHTFSDEDAPHIDEFDSKGIENSEFKAASKSSGSSYIASFLGPSKEQRRAKQEFEKWQKEFREKAGDTFSLPPEYLPSAWACLALFATLSMHALFHLLCHWVVSFKAMMLYVPAVKVEENCFVLITPPPNRGQPALVLLKKSSATGQLQLEFQRQKYIYTPASKLGTISTSKPYKNGVFTLFSYPINLPLSLYFHSVGLKSESEIEKTLEKWGKNHLAVAIPSFLQLLQIQLLSPLAIFQVFCALLWLLDEYWSYTFFTLVSVVIFEATTVFQRSRTQQMLGGMSPKPSPIYAYRNQKWVIITSKDLLPGDIISLSFKRRSNLNTTNIITGSNPSPTSTASTARAAPVNSETSASSSANSSSITSRDDIVPCDCLLLKGSAVVNEASLTGESVPQMKEALLYHSHSETSESTDKESEVLEMSTTHRVHTLFSGTSIVTVYNQNQTITRSYGTAGSIQDSELTNQDTKLKIPTPPDDGAVAYVLRTGFGSSQGALLQMIEFSQQSVTGNAKETGLVLLLLFFFALLASGYVLKEGLRKKEKTTHELLLKCVIIITSVVPRQFPMQMAMAVNMALMSLSKSGIFCTEPYRVPLAGKVTHCLFDKTGTLTTDQLVPAGIINYHDHENVSLDKSSNVTTPTLAPVVTASGETAMILAACHSLVVVESDKSKGKSTAGKDDDDEDETPVKNDAMPMSSTLVGDPIELAAMKAVDWSWDAATSTAKPDGALKRQQLALVIIKQKREHLLSLPADTVTPQHKLELKSLEDEMAALESKIAQSKDKAAQSVYTAIEVVQRHHFSSALQRMSVVCRCHDQNRQSDYLPDPTKNSLNLVKQSNTKEQKRKSGHTSGVKHDGTDVGDDNVVGDWYCLVKGSPEALKPLILPNSLPSWYSSCYEALARKGLRVLALAFKKVSSDDTPQDKSRTWVESGLMFGGFIAFECKIRSDSGVVVQALIQSDHKVIMLTGDALLTSLHVAKEVAICISNKKVLTLGYEAIETNDSSVKHVIVPFWTERDESTGIEKRVTYENESNTLYDLSTKYNMLTTEEVFLKVIFISGKESSPLWKIAGNFCVFSRMSPQGKASIIKAIQDESKDAHVFMCGDGGNDVGALKQADVGLALLSGHANSNTSTVIKPTATITSDPTTSSVVSTGNRSNSTTAEDLLNEHEKQLKKRNDDLNKLRTAHMKDFQAKYTREQQAVLQEEIRIRTERGDYMAMFNIMKEQAGKIKQAMAEENMRFMAMHGQVWDPERDGDGVSDGTSTNSMGSIEKLMETMDGGESAGGMPIVRPGDASVAAPFTSRIPSVRAVVDLIRQGRCTLLSALMQQQIMMLEAIIAAYTLSALSLHNARSSERQMMASSWLIMTAAISFSYASPLDHMHPLRPLSSLFHPAIIISILGQAAIHIACMTLAVQWATDAMGPDALKEVTEFFKKVKSNEIDRQAHCGEEDYMCQLQAYWTAPFLPNLLNSVVFLVETSQMISVYFANYKGRPWMKGMIENHPLFLSVFLCIAGVAIAAWEVIPQLNTMIQLAPFPDDAFRYKVVALVIATIAGTFAWDRLCTMLFAPKVFQASMMELKKTTWQDFVPIAMTALKVAGGLLLLGTGNILLIGAAFWYYRSYSQQQATTTSSKAK